MNDSVNDTVRPYVPGSLDHLLPKDVAHELTYLREAHNQLAQQVELLGGEAQVLREKARPVRKDFWKHAAALGLTGDATTISIEQADEVLNAMDRERAQEQSAQRPR